MSSGCNLIQFYQKFEKLEADNLSSDLDGVIYICEAWSVNINPWPASRYSSPIKVQVAAPRGKYTANIEVKRCTCINTHLIPTELYISKSKCFLTQCRWGPRTTLSNFFFSDSTPPRQQSFIYATLIFGSLRY